MVSSDDLYINANILIKEQGSYAKAEEFVAKKLQHYIDARNNEGAAVWLSIGNAIEDLQLREKQKHLF